jgi:hypothetical protein
LRVNTKGYQGNITKKARVHTNDPNIEVETLSIKAFVKVPIHLSPRYVHLRGLAGQTIAKTITIRAQKDKPLNIETSHFDLEYEVVYKVEEVEKGRIFRIHFSNIPGPAKSYRGFLKLKTNYPEKPEITIIIRGTFRKSGKS